MSSISIRDVPLSYALTASAYCLQKISDFLWIDSVYQSTKISTLASIRHYRASNILGMSIFDIRVDFPTVENDASKEDIIDNFCDIENILDESIHCLTINTKREQDIDSITSLEKMIMHTRNAARFSVDFSQNKLSLYDNRLMLDKYICIQCGEIYDIDNISECDYCGAGINHIEQVKELI